MDFSQFDQRGYPSVDSATGYDRWAPTYEDAVCDEMDLRLLARVRSIDWRTTGAAIDLACGTGRIGAWLRERCAAQIDGIDVSSGMLELARARGLYRSLLLADARHTGLDGAGYDLAVASLADEHLPDIVPLYREAARLVVPGGAFVLVGYHPQFIMTHGMPTHFHGEDGEAVAIETHVHLLSDHINAGTEAGFGLCDMHEGLIDDEYIAAKPKWEKHRGTPVSFCVVWRRDV